jgi:hypothetical protein
MGEANGVHCYGLAIPKQSALPKVKAPVVLTRLRVGGGCFLIVKALFHAFDVRETYQVRVFHVTHTGNHEFCAMPLNSRHNFLSVARL